MNIWSPEPASAPGIAVTSGSAGAETVHVMWSTVNQTNPTTFDVMWYTSWTNQPWPLPTPYLSALGSTRPRLAVGPQGRLHAAFLTYRRDTSLNDADYVERLSSDDLPLPPPESDASRLLFPTATESDDVRLAVSTGADGLEHGHLVWSEYSAARGLPLLYYGRAYRQPDHLTPTADALSWLGAADCVDPGSASPDCYRGYKPSVAVVDRPGGTDKDLVVTWEGRDNFAPQTPVIYSGLRRLCAEGETCLWSPPQPVSNNQLNKMRGTRQACSTQDSQPTLKAVSPSLAMSPRRTLHAVWLQQREADGPYYVHTARLVYDEAAQDYCWDYYDTVDSEPAPPQTTGQPPTEQPRLAFDRQGRRYAFWNVGPQRLVVATSDLDAASSTGDHDVYLPWEVHGAINTGDCAGQNGARGVEVATTPGSQFVHVVWTAVNPNAYDQGKICYARLGYGYQTFVPRIDKRANSRH